MTERPGGSGGRKLKAMIEGKTGAKKLAILEFSFRHDGAAWVRVFPSTCFASLPSERDDTAVVAWRV